MDLGKLTEELYEELLKIPLYDFAKRKEKLREYLEKVRSENEHA